MITYFERALKWTTLLLFAAVLVLYAFGIGDCA